MQIDRTSLLPDLCEKIRGQILGLSEPLGPEANLFDAGLDSMGIMRLIVLVEEDYGVTIPDDAITEENFKTPQAVASYIERIAGQAI